MKHTGNTLAPGSILFPIETGVTVAPSCQGGLSRPLLLSPGSSEGSDSHGDLSLERGENALLTVAGNGNGPCSPHSSTSQLPGFRWLLLALGTTAGNGQLPLSSPHRAD